MSQLHVVTAYMNPVGWSSRLALYHAFESHMLQSGVHLTTVEVAYGDAPFQLDGCAAHSYIPVRAAEPLWHKECALNIGIRSLPPEAAYVAWLDADITFLNPHWATDTVDALRVFDVVQPWTTAHDLDASGKPMLIRRALCNLVQHGEPIIQSINIPQHVRAHAVYGHPGYCWAARKETLEAIDGLYDLGILGSGDFHMAMAFLGRVHESAPWTISDGYMSSLIAWQKRAQAHIRKIGSVSGTILHSYHGAKKNRRYTERWDVLIEHEYDPAKDIERKGNSLLRLIGKEELGKAIASYFAERAEDS